MKKLFKLILKVIFSATVIGGFVFAFRAPLQILYLQLLSQYFPCSQPIAYSIGSFDKRFGLSQKDFLSAIVQAEQIWEKPITKELFAYTTDGKLKINLIYDIRQEATIKLQKLGIAVKDDKASYNTVKAKYEAVKAQYAREKAALDAKIAEFEILKNKYEADVEYWNSRGGARKETYAQLEEERLALNAAIAGINKMQDDLNAKVDDINALVVVLNRLAASLNITAEKYNQIGDQLGGEFEEGTYQSGPSGREIDIYQFDNRAKLIRVLAHELGHALGLDHLEDPKAIMYRLNNGINEKLTDSDLVVLKSKCRL